MLCALRGCFLYALSMCLKRLFSVWLDLHAPEPIAGQFAYSSMCLQHADNILSTASSGTERESEREREERVRKLSHTLLSLSLPLSLLSHARSPTLSLSHAHALPPSLPPSCPLSLSHTHTLTDAIRLLTCGIRLATDVLYSLEHLHASSVASASSVIASSVIIASSVMASSVMAASADTIPTTSSAIPTTSSATDIKEKDQLRELREPPAAEAAKQQAQAEADAGFSRALLPLI
jgi:hypothetical protein